MILTCDCSGHGGVKNAALFQDQLYGVKQRAHNPTTTEDMFRCTVCGTEHKKPGKTLSKKELKALKEAEKAAKAEKQQKEQRRR